MKYVDSHCHLTRYRDPGAVLRAAEQADVVTVCVTELPSEFQRLALRIGKRPGARVALGIHPLRASAATATEMALFARLLDRANYVGEVGLDGSREGKPTLRSQRRVFQHLLGQPRVGSKVLTVHSRGAEAEVIACLTDAKASAILHWYSGPLKHIEPALSAGIYFSVNPAMTRSQNGQRIISALPPDRVITETDGPWAKIAGKPAEPKDIPSVVVQLARVWREDPDQARARVYENMSRLAKSARGE